MKKIWKYVLRVRDVNRILMPRAARIVHIGLDPVGNLALWAEVYPENPEEARYFVIFGTGHPIMKKHERHHYDYLGTVHIGSFMWHIYESWEETVRSGGM